MAKSLVIAEDVNLAALMDRGKAVEFFFKSNDFSLGDIYSARVENILPSIDAVFVSLGSEKMGFLHASDIPGIGPLSDRVWPRQKLLVQVVKEPTGNKGPRVSTNVTLIGRFYVLTTEHDNIVMSRRITSANERARLKSIATLLKPPVGFGLIIRTEAMGATDQELEEDFRELFLERWKYIIDQFEIQRRPGLLFSDSKDLLYRTLRDVFHDGVDRVAVDNETAAKRAKHYLELWSHNPPQVDLRPSRELLKEYNVIDELKMALSDRIDLPSGGYVHIQPTEALTVIDVNSGKFTSSRNPGETILKTNIEAATEAARQLRLRNIGGVIVIDFIDMESKFDRLKVLEHFEKLLDTDPAHPQIGRLSDLGLVELTRHRQEKSLIEALGHNCEKCHGVGWVFPIFDYLEGTSTEKPENLHSGELETLRNSDNSDGQDSNTEEQREYRGDRVERNDNRDERGLDRENSVPERTIERIIDNGIDRGTERGSERSIERGSDRGGDRNSRYPRRNNERPHHQNRNQRSGGGQRYRDDNRGGRYDRNNQGHHSSGSRNSLEDQLLQPEEQFRRNNAENENRDNENEERILEIPQQNKFEENSNTEVVPPIETNTNQVEPNYPRVLPLKNNHQVETVVTQSEPEPPPQPEPELPTFSLGDNSTKEVLPGIFSFEDNSNDNN
ncbi:MAG: Rne/Rng family ribonuclease [Candidatus Caenarcaniphilales bacterium]|nr:Rne/Rng family ribonuclease [Candidatus Caenarcaniphilales bacterium]